MTPEREAEIKNYVVERDAILLAGDVDGMIEFYKRHNPGQMFSSRGVAEIAMHKARAAVKNMPMQARQASKSWLVERGYESMDDGEVPLPASSTDGHRKDEP